jgi:hypothetical protein
MMAPSIKLNGSKYKEWKLLTMDYLHLMDHRDHALGMVKPPRPLIISRIPITITQSLSSTTPPVTGERTGLLDMTTRDGPENDRMRRRPHCQKR